MISEITNIPVGDISAAEKEKLTQIEDRLKGHIFGQDEALTEIARFLKRARTGLSDPNRPLGSFLFLGPTGVGKTQTAQVLAREMFSENALIRIDMSEFGEPFAVSRLIGAPPGYIGFREGGKLTEAVRRKPYSVILFDEIEKAHPDVFHILLQVLDSGRLTDAEGKTVDFKNCVVILTSNIGMTLLNEQAKIGFSLGSSAGISAMAHFETQYQEAQASILKELKRFFRPEFLNRLDSIIFFAPLHRDAITKIVVKELERIQTSMQAHGSAFRWNTKVVQILANSYDPQEGGRGIKRIIQKQIEGPLADLLLTHGKQKPVSFTARVKQGNVELEIVGNGSGR